MEQIKRGNRVIFEVDAEDTYTVQALVFATEMRAVLFEITHNLWRGPLKWGGVGDDMMRTIDKLDIKLTEAQLYAIIESAENSVEKVFSSIRAEIGEIPVD